MFSIIYVTNFHDNLWHLTPKKIAFVYQTQYIKKALTKAEIDHIGRFHTRLVNNK